jgi:magnesium-protoporphyrin IX monomethyl ester (oxidative) cyclase
MKTEVLFVHPPITFKKMSPGFDNIPPLGILYLAATLEKAGIGVKVIDDVDSSVSIEAILKTIKEEQPKVVGISSTTCQIKASVELATEIRKAFNEDVKICIGGCHVSADSDLIKRYPVFDIAVIGEGEKTFTALVQKILAGQDIKGVFMGEPVEDLDSIPFPAYHLVDMERLKKRGMDSYPIMGTRGCQFKCTFCSRPGLSGYGRNVRSRSAKNILDEMEPVIKEYNGNFGFQDDSFTANREAVIEFCEEVIRQGLKIRWGAGGVRIDKIDDELLQYMTKAGCNAFCFGIESGSDRVRNRIVRKGLRSDKILKALEICNKYPLDIQLSFIVGFPTETKEEMLETAMFARGLIDKGIRCIEYIGIRPAVPLPGAPLFDRAIKEQKIPSNLVDQFIQGKLGDEFRDNWPVYVPDGISKEEMLAIRKKGYQAFYFTPYYIKRRVIKDITSWKRLKKDVAEAISIITAGRSKGSLS